MAAAGAAAAGARFDALLFEVIEEVRTTWADLYLLERSIANVGESRDLLANIEEVARDRFSSGEGTYAEILRVQVELGRLEDHLESLKDRRRPVEARMNAVLHRAPGAELPTALALEDRGDLLEDGALHERLLEASPTLRALRLAVEATDAGIELATIARRPTVTIGGEYISTGGAISPGVPGSGDDPIVASLSLTLPVRTDRYVALERQARARHRAAVADLAREVDRQRATLEQQLYLARDTSRQIQLYRESLVPRARQAYEVTETAFRSGEATFLDLIDSERVLLEFGLSLDRAQAERAQALARLDRLVGGPVTTNASEDTPR